jgi:hypothetical protein
VSFVKEFCLQEEHLHSARTFFYPLSRVDQLPIMAFMVSSLIFTAAVIIHLIDTFIRGFERHIIDLPYRILAVLYAWMVEYYLTHNNFYTLLLATAFFLGSILEDGQRLFGSSRSLQPIPKTYLEYLMTPISGS